MACFCQNPCFCQGKVKIISWHFFKKNSFQKKSEIKKISHHVIQQDYTQCILPSAVIQTYFIHPCLEDLLKLLTYPFIQIYLKCSYPHSHPLIFLERNRTCDSVTLPKSNLCNPMMNFPCCSPSFLPCPTKLGLGLLAVWGSDLILGVPATEAANLWLMLPTSTVYRQQLFASVKEEFWVFCVPFKAWSLGLFLGVGT